MPFGVAERGPGSFETLEPMGRPVSSRGFLHNTALAGIEEKPNGISRAGIGTEHRFVRLVGEPV
jgi:hypothetical protein